MPEFLREIFIPKGRSSSSPGLLAKPATLGWDGRGFYAKGVEAVDGVGFPRVLF